MSLKDWSWVKVAPVVIENKAWIGLNALIMNELRIGEGAVGAAASDVTRDVEPRTTVVGNPAGATNSPAESER